MFGYIARHWRGELSLPQSYWVNGVLVGLPFNLYAKIVAASFREDPPHSPSTYVYALLLPTLAMLPVAVWQGVGVWRSAGLRIDDGQYGWAWVARLVVLGNLALLIYAAIAYGALNYSLVRATIDESTARFTVKDHGSYVVFHGEITEAAAEQLEPLLSAPQTRRLVINASNGGFIQPTLRLAKIIADRKLMVMALSQCASSCTGLLAAGRVRAIALTTSVDFHRGTLPGIDREATQWGRVEDYYRSAGMTKALFDKMRAHAGSYDVYRATLREMIEGGFINQVYDLDAKKYYLAPQWCAAKPAQCDRTGLQNQAERHGIN
jgi:hypothetical protein